MLKHILATVQKHVAAEYPRECCGAIVSSDKARQYVRCRNTANQPQGEFRMRPEDYATAEDLGRVTAIVYSHPDATSRPSPRGLTVCETSDLPWHIPSWPEGDLRTIAPAGNIPLLGRPLVYGT